MTVTHARSLSERIADGEPNIGGAPVPDLVDAVVLITHRIRDVCDDDGDDSAQAGDLRAQRRRVRSEIVRRTT